MQYMSGVLLARAKEVRDDGSIVEISIWQLPEPLPPSAHRYKYRLYYGAGGISAYGMTTSAARVTTGTSGSVKRTTASEHSRNCRRISDATSTTGGNHEGNHRGGP